MTKRVALLTALLALAAVPTALAHASPDPLDNEVHLLADDTDDAYAYYDGFDLQDLYVREAYDRDAEEDGLMFRMVVYGGPAPASVAGQHHLDLTFEAGGAEHRFRISSSDGLTWSGDLKVRETSLEIEEGTGAVEGSIQAWIANSALGIGPGDTVGGFLWENYADDDLRDAAPGGRYLPGSGGEVDLGGQSVVVTDAITLAGPQGYTRTTVEPLPNGTVAIQVENLITVIGQHIVLELPETPGWETRAIDLSPRVAEPGDNPRFVFFVETAPPAGDLTLQLTTDLGGREILTVPASAFAVQQDGTVDKDAREPGGAPDDAGEDSPLGLPILVVAIAVALLLRRH